jgi:RNA polymerase sigma-70 factor (ECF subfamily)
VGSTRPPSEHINAIYQRLLAGEIDAPSDLIELLLDPLTTALRRKFPSLPDPNLVTDTATDTLFRFVQEPERFQPERGDLWGYLYMDALGDIRNAWQKQRRRLIREIPFDPVAHDLPDGNSNVEEAIVRKLVPASLPDGTDAASLINQLRADIPDARDWEVVTLMALGERSTSIYASVLEITDLPPAEQRRRVKQAKDRLRLRLKRSGVRINEHETH